MTNLERDRSFNTGSMVALVFASLIWKGATLKIRLVHAAILFVTFFLVRFAYARFTVSKGDGPPPETED